MFRKPDVIGVCEFQLFAVQGKPHRANYSAQSFLPNIPVEFVITRTWPQFLEVNWPLIPDLLHESLTSSIVSVIADFEAGVTVSPTPPHDEELLAGKFVERLMLGRRMTVSNAYEDPIGRSNPIDVYDAFVVVAPRTLGLALAQLPSRSADELKFFVAYGFAKWRRQGYPTFISSIWKSTWDFEHIDKMIEEYNQWHPDIA